MLKKFLELLKRIKFSKNENKVHLEAYKKIVLHKPI